MFKVTINETIKSNNFDDIYFVLCLKNKETISDISRGNHIAILFGVHIFVLSNVVK